MKEDKLTESEDWDGKEGNPKDWDEVEVKVWLPEGRKDVEPSGERWSEEERRDIVGGILSALRSPSSWDAAFSRDIAYDKIQYLIEDYLPALNKEIEKEGKLVEFYKTTKELVFDYLLFQISTAIEDLGAVNWETNEETKEFEPVLLLDSRGE